MVARDMLNQMPSTTEREFHLDRERSEPDKQRRERHFHVVEVPMLRVIGFSMIALLVLLRYTFVPGNGDVHPLWVGAIGMAYSLAAWGVLYVGFEKLKPRVNLGTVFLALDVVIFIVAIYLTGGDRSWLFFLLFIRTADQANTTFKRALEGRVRLIRGADEEEEKEPAAIAARQIDRDDEDHDVEGKKDGPKIDARLQLLEADVQHAPRREAVRHSDRADPQRMNVAVAGHERVAQEDE